MLAIDPTNANVVYAGTDYGSGGYGPVLKTTTGGASWTPIGLSNTGIIALAVDPSNPATVYAGTRTGVYRTATNQFGSTIWIPIANGIGYVYSIAVDPQNPNTIYAGTSSFGVVKLTAHCGDGLVDVTEACDLGTTNATPGTCCTASCSFAPSSHQCRAAADACDLAEFCTGSDDQCSWDYVKDDQDGDATCDELDNCVLEFNPDQLNSDSDPNGDVCDVCPTDPADVCSQQQTASGVIGQSGGTLTTPDGSVALDVPPGTVASETTFSITGGIKKSEFGAGSSSKNLVTLVQLEPDGVVFDPPVTVTFAWPDVDPDDGKVDGTNIREKNLKVFRNGAVVPGTTTCESQPCTSAACCDMVGNTWALRVNQFSEWGVGIEPCAELSKSQLTLTKLLAPTGDDRLGFKGELTLAGAPNVATQLDIVEDGIIVRLVDGDTVVLDAEVPGGPYDVQTKVGWKVNNAHTKWTYTGPKVSAPGGITKVIVQDKSAKKPGLVAFSVKGGPGTYAAGTAVDPAVVLPDAGLCFEATYPQTPPSKPSCISSGVGATTKCK